VGPEAELRYRAGSWEVVDPSMLGGARVVRALSAPTFANVSTNTTVAGSLTEATTYYYTAALRDQDGNYTTLGTTRNATAPASGSLILLMQIATTPADLVIWRRDQSGVESAPDVYVVIPVNGYDFRGYDTGTHINGRPWVDSDVPVPNTVAAANATSDRLVLPGDPLAGLWTPADQGMLAWSFDPGQADLTNANITSGTLHLVTLNCPAAEISNFHIRIGTGGTAVAHAFMAAYDYHSGALLGATADLTTNWQAAGTKTHAASSAFTHKGGKIRVGFYAEVTNGNVAVGRGNGTSTILNANLGTAASRCGTADTGLTTALPDPHDTVAASANLWWVALS